MKRYNLFKISFLLFIFSIGSCSQKIFRPKYLGINYTSVINANAIYGWYFNKYGEKIYIKSNKDSLINIYNIFPSFLFLGANNKIHQPIIIQPKERINIRKEGDRHFFDNQTKDCNYKLSEELETRFGTAHLGELLGKNDPPIEDFLSEDAYKNKRFITSQKFLLTEQLDYIHKFQLSYKVDENYLKLVKTMICDYYMLRLILHAMSLEYTTLVSREDLNTEIIGFKEKIKNRIDYKKGIELHAQRLVFFYNRFLCKKYIGQKEEFNAQWESANKNFVGQSKEFLKFILLKKYMFKHFDNYDSYLSDFLKKTKDFDYKFFLTEMYKTNTHQFGTKELNDIVIDTLDKSITISNLLNKYKGKNIILDFWASWCIPCREEMIEYKNIEKDFEKLNIVTLFISIDENKKSWLSSIPKTQTTNYEHYKIDKNTSIYNFFDLKSIPRYILIDENGKVKAFEAPRPSDKENLLKIIQK